MRGPYQLSHVLDFGAHEGERIEDVIERHPHYMQSLVSDGTVVLAAGSARYLRERLEEWLDEHPSDNPLCGLAAACKGV